MATKAPVLIAPAMNTGMYSNPILQRNIEVLKSYGYNFVDPDEGRLACGTTGVGKLADTEKIVDMIDMKAKIREGNKTVEGDIPADLKDTVEEYRNMIIEAAAQTDEELMEKFFGGEELTKEEVVKGLRLGVISGDVVPVLCGAASKNIGIDVLMDTILNYMPSPADAAVPEAMNLKSNQKAKVSVDANAPFSAL
jgi:elongation factor G